MKRAETLKDARAKLRDKYDETGPTVPDTVVIVLRRDSMGYIPCVAYISHVTKAGKIAVDLWSDRSERAVVSLEAVFWPKGGQL